ncbi:glycosylphosphatidylinositol anchor biosynthesis [Tilletia horrida]|uniref:Mannosyltransferase n=1 Tax=Tilletia horrida TaxID=155126 RepID=A0AAN6GR60_9BASI|nr:glycosylphosphatidylinositol anchor biosynthesis [Tilletia horrida]
MKHFSAPADLPVYALDFLTEDVVVYAGGGGAGRSGVKNAIRTARVDVPSESIKELSRLELSRDEDAPMCIAVNKSLGSLVAGINSVAEKVKANQNESLRVFDFEVKESDNDKEDKDPASPSELSATVTFVKSAPSLPITNPEEYQFVLHTFPSLTPAWQTPEDAFTNGSGSAEELYSADFSFDSEQVVIASGQKIKVFSTSPAPLDTSSSSSGEKSDSSNSSVKRPLKIQTILNPALGGAGPCTFRAARFGRAPTSEKVLFTVVNAGPGKGSAKGKRKSFVSSWNAETWELVQTRHVADKPITAFDVSADGKLLAFGCSDLSVGVLDAKTLRPVLRILDAHSFPPTCIKLSPSGKTLVSGSADNTLRVIEIPSTALIGANASNNPKHGRPTPQALLSSMSTRASSKSGPSLFTLFAVLLSFRLLNAALTQTFFQPDEFWQSLEIAHRIVFGYGYQTWEWRDERASLPSGSAPWQGWLGGWWQDVVVGSPIRSIAYPAIFVPVYWLLKNLQLDNTFLLTLLPRLTQALFAAVGDFYTFRLAQRVTSIPIAYIWLLLNWTSPYSLHTATRTFSNSLEASLMSAALFCWPTSTFEGKSDVSTRHTQGSQAKGRRSQPSVNIYPSLAFMGFAFIVRPTSAIMSIYLGLDLILFNAPRAALPSLLIQTLIVGSAILSWQTLLDSWFYGRLTVTALAFLQVNVLGGSPVSLFYGAQPLHYYLTQGLPVIATALTPWVVTGWAVCLTGAGARGLSNLRESSTLALLARASLWVTLCMSALGHKEWRFLQQLGPIWILFAAVIVSQQAHERKAEPAGKVSESSRNQHTELSTSRPRSAFSQIFSELASAWQTLHSAAHKSEQSRPSSSATKLPAWSNRLLNALPPLPYLLLAQLPLTIYLLVGHGRGQMHIMRYLHEAVVERQSGNGLETHGKGTAGIKSVGFLMPCHSTPWQAWMHAPELEVRRPTGADEEREQAGWNGSGDGGRAWFLTCEPPLQGQDLRTYRDQTKVFFEDPLGYLQTRFPSLVDPNFPPSPFLPAAPGVNCTSGRQAENHPDWKHAWPSHFALFETLLDRKGVIKNGNQGTVRDFLREKGYAEVKRIWNGVGSDDENRWGDVLVLAWQGAKSK